MNLEKLNPIKAIDKYIHKGFKDSDGKDRKLGSAYSAKDWARREKFAKQNHPFLYKTFKFIEDTDIWFSRQYSRWFSDPYWYIYHRFYKKSHLIDTGLKKGKWYDADTIILHGMMSELVNFIEVYKEGYPWELVELDKKENGLPNCIDGDMKTGSPGMGDRQWKGMKEAWDIYQWWKEYPAKQKAVDDMLDDIKHVEGLSVLEDFDDDTYREHNSLIFDKYHRAEEDLQEEETEMLIRLIKIRESLIT